MGQNVLRKKKEGRGGKQITALSATGFKFNNVGWGMLWIGAIS